MAAKFGREEIHGVEEGFVGLALRAMAGTAQRDKRGTAQSAGPTGGMLSMSS
jgi:hypothetical protein